MFYYKTAFAKSGECTIEAFETQQSYPEAWIATEEEYLAFKHRIATQRLMHEIEHKLTTTDYVAIKIAEGAATRDDYAEVIDNRRLWREKINELKAELDAYVTNKT